MCLFALPFLASHKRRVQVLAKALEVWNLNLENLDAPNMRQTAQQPEQENAFICNLQVSTVTP